MKPGRYYRHKHALDAHIYVKSVVESTEAEDTFEISWYVRRGPLNFHQKAALTKEQQENWEECSSDGMVPL